MAALRAFLAFDPDEGVRLTKRLVEVGPVGGYGELVYAAFVTAIRRRFHPGWTIADVIRLVATMRARRLDPGIEIDTRAAEILIRRALGETVAGELGDETEARAQIFLLAELVADEELDDAGLDEFLAQARPLANQLAG
ncbi:hypothetical protein NE236_30980 [Actinoallomurus purpureus]|uniref:hypothetical protein n=1 Tax=Actinoallomurus purpureus TaxID=478114 RepID=UPI0020920C57|nr:hypothetical protein [Actinoallomurus purpureus]MCO6009404.1 hypothetical protein [Actinoallomurus purpureus]